MSFTNLLAWYLTPWLRIDRKTFNIAFAVVTLPPMIIGVADTASFISPLLHVAEAGRAVANDPAATTNFVTGLQQAAGSSPAESGFSWSDLFGILSMLALGPLIAARARDCGHEPLMVKVLTGLALAAPALNLLKLGLPHLSLGPLGFAAGAGGFAVILWLGVRKSAPKPDRTSAHNPAILPGDDDYPDPFKPR